MLRRLFCVRTLLSWAAALAIYGLYVLVNYVSVQGIMADGSSNREPVIEKAWKASLEIFELATEDRPTVAQSVIRAGPYPHKTS